MEAQTVEPVEHYNILAELVVTITINDFVESHRDLIFLKKLY